MIKIILKCFTCQTIFENNKKPKIFYEKEISGSIVYIDNRYWKCKLCGNKNYLPKELKDEICWIMGKKLTEEITGKQTIDALLALFEKGMEEVIGKDNTCPKCGSDQCGYFIKEIQRSRLKKMKGEK